MIKIWILAIRPRTLIASASPVLIGTAIGWHEGSFSLPIFLFTLLTALGIQISTNLVNDYFDYAKGADSKTRVGEIRVMQAGLVSKRVMQRAIFSSFTITAFLGSYLIWQGGVIIAALVAISLLLALVYTAGPFPLAYLGAAELFIFPFFGPIAVAGTAFLQTGQLHFFYLVAGIAPGLLSCALVIINNLRDREEDQKVGKKTLAVRLGPIFGMWEFAIAVLVATLVPLFCMPFAPRIWWASVTLVLAVRLIYKLIKTERTRLDQLMPQVALLLFLYTLLFCIGVM